MKHNPAARPERFEPFLASFGGALSTKRQIPEWLMGGLFGLLATLLVFLLQMWWDNSKLERERSEKDEATYSALKEELSDNIKILTNNVRFIEKDLELLEVDKQILTPLDMLRDSSWELARLSQPRQLKTKPSAFTDLQDLYLVVRHTNEAIRSRETHRINNKALSGYVQTLKNFDKILLEETKRLELALERISTDIAK